MASVYVVWYRESDGREFMYGIYKDDFDAMGAVTKIQKAYGLTAWYNEEEVQ